MTTSMRVVPGRSRIRRVVPCFIVSLIGVFSLCSAAGAQSLMDRYAPVTEAMLLSPPDGEWLMWRRTYDHWGYSPLDQINESNVGTLRLAWAWTLEPGGFQETTPLVHDGVMFLPQACDFVEAVDARDGMLIWEYRRERVEHPTRQACANRNAALYGDHLILATHDAYLVALDAHTGEVIWEEQVGDWTIGHHYSGGPQIIKGQVVAGMSGCYIINTGCWISAHDVETGEELWRTRTIPRQGEPGSETWGALPDEQRLGGSAWIAPSYDPGLNLIYIGVAVPIPWGSVQRDTGRRRRPLHQLDAGPERRFRRDRVVLPASAGRRMGPGPPLRAHPGRDRGGAGPGRRHVVESRHHPGPTEGGHRYPRQARPRLDIGRGHWRLPLGARNELPERNRGCRPWRGGGGIANSAIKPSAIEEETLVCPTLNGGGINWQAVAYSPQTNALYAPTNNTCMTYSLNPVEPTLGTYHGSATFRRVQVPNSDEQVGQLTAVEVATGETRWVYRQRAGIGGSVLSTGGGLVFVTDDARRFRAFDADTGEILWEQILNSSAGGYPVSYSVDGIQYIAIAAGGGVNYRSITPEIRQRSQGNTLFVFRLP